MAFEIKLDRGPAYQFGSAALIFSSAALLTALGYQYIGGLVPCELCLMQRYAYYAAIPVLFAAIALASAGKRGWAAALFFLVSLAFLANAGLGTYHAGAEWKYWPGPATCTGEQAISTSAGSLLKEIEGVRVVRCDEASWRLFGLSFAGWNVVASLLLMLLTLRAAFASADSRG